THQMDGGHVAPRRPNLLGIRRFSDLEPLLEIGVPQRGGILVVAMDDLRKRHTELVLVARELDAVLDVRQSLAERIDAGQSTRRAFHEGSEIRAKQIEAGMAASTTTLASCTCRSFLAS